MNIIIRYHAIERFRERVFYAQKWSDEQIKERIRLIVKKGVFIKRKPGDAKEIRFEGIYLTIAQKGNTTIVITCNGDSAYRRWHYGKRKIS